jgi:hypothetical protein
MASYPIRRAAALKALARFFSRSNRLRANKTRPLPSRQQAAAFSGTIGSATEDDIQAIWGIAQSLKLDEKNPQKSFLLADFTEDDYHAFLNDAENYQDHVHFLTAKDSSGTCLGFLLAYSEKYVGKKSKTWRKRGTERSILDLLTPRQYLLIPNLAQFYIVKQIGVDLGHQAKGIGRELYSHFFGKIEADYVFSAIVAEPKNEPSEAFHRSFGFFPFMQSYSFSSKSALLTHSDAGSERRPHVNHIWLRPSLPPVYAYSGRPNLDLPLPDELFRRNFDHVARLYMHEDSLNWTKLSAMTAALVGFTAIAAYLLHDMRLKPESADRLLSSPSVLIIIVTLTITWGSFILGAFVVALQSGLLFMHSHKQILKIMEAHFKLTSTNASFISPLWRLPAQSKTAAYLRLSHFVIFVVWLVLCLFLLEQMWRSVFHSVT